MKTVFNKVMITLALCAVSSLACAADTAAPSTPDKAPSLLKSVPMVVSPDQQKSQQLIKIGYADMARIAAESDLGKSSQAKVKEKQDKLQAQIASRRKQLDKQKASLEAKMAAYTPKQREAKAREFQKKVEAFQTFGMGAEKELQQLQEELSKQLYGAIEKASAECGKANNLAAIFVKRELLYMAGGVDAQDMTAGIIKLMNGPELKK